MEAAPHIALLPAGQLQLRAGAGGVEIGHADDVHPVRAARLGEEHRAELARADDGDGDRLAGGFPFEKQSVQVHAPVLSSPGRPFGPDIPFLEEARMEEGGVRGCASPGAGCRRVFLPAGRSFV